VKLQTSIPSQDVDCSYLTDLSPNDRPWDDHALERDQVRNLYLAKGHKYALSMSNCSLWLEFALKPSLDTSDLKFKLQSARFCRVRHCPVCQWRRSLKWRAKFLQVLPKIQDDHSTYQYLFLTLTVKNCPIDTLHQTLTAMNTAWAKLVKRKVFSPVGWVKSAEVTKSKNGEAHPHFHVLLMVKPDYFVRNYISQVEWSDLWRDSMQLDYQPVVHVRKVQPKKLDDPHQGLRDAVCETLKYQVKPSDLVNDADWLCELTKQLHRTRAVSVGGLFKTYLSDLGDEPDDLININDDSSTLLDEDFGKFLFHWQYQDKRYKSNS